MIEVIQGMNIRMQRKSLLLSGIIGFVIIGILFWGGGLKSDSIHLDKESLPKGQYNKSFGKLERKESNKKISGTTNHRNSDVSKSKTSSNNLLDVVDTETFSKFDNWLNQQDSLKLEEAIQVAKLRRVEMLKLIKQDPQQAMENAISFSDYAKLPEKIAVLVEKPFSQQVDLNVLPDESGQQGTHIEIWLKDENKSYQLTPYGKREKILSKSGLSAQGFLLGELSLIKDEALMPLEGEDVAYAISKFPPINSYTKRDFYTHEIIKSEPVLALAGGKLFYFAKFKNIQKLNKQLTELEKKLGPKSSSRVLFSMYSANSSSQATPVAVQMDLLLASPSGWTTTKKKVYMIRIDFPDKPGEPISQATLMSEFNGAVSSIIRDMSRNKTWIEADVSSQVVRLPNDASSYESNENNSGLHADAVTAFNALGTGVNLDDYDIVGVYFTDIGMRYKGSSYAGLASIGGGNLWLQNTHGTRLIAHELGHNYGLGHASFWETTDGSVIGASGASQTYGDIYDLMGGGNAPKGFYHPQGLSKLDWLTNTEWQEVTSSGIYRIYRFDHKDATGLQGLKVARGNGDFYWLGYRQNYDANNWLESGAYLIWQKNNTSRSWLIDTTPDSFADTNDDKRDAGIVLGQTYSDTDANVYITTVNKGGVADHEWLDIQVNLGATPGNHAPTVNITAPATINARETVTFTASAADPDGDDLAYKWDFGDEVISNNLNNVNHSWIVGGTYTVKVTVSDMKGGSVTSQVVVNVEDPLLTWETRSSGTTDDLTDIATNGSMIVAVGKNNVLRSDDDGVSWTSDNTAWQNADGSNYSAGNLRIQSILYGNNKWLIAGYDYDFDINAWVGIILTSDDAETWTKRYRGGDELRSIAGTSGLYIVVGDEGSILKSTDGSGWTVVNSGTSSDLKSVAFGNGSFVAVGVIERTYYSSNDGVILTSVNGMNWMDTSTGAGSSVMNDVTYENDRFLGTGFYAGIRSSVDNGASFIKVRNISSHGPKAHAYGNGVYLMLGESSQNMVSVNANNWDDLDISSAQTRNAAIFFNNTFIAVGASGSIYQSLPIPVLQPDSDNDGIADDVDNCPAIANANQNDQDGDEIGDVCDNDIDGDGVINANDAFPADPAESVDTDLDGIGDNADIDDDNDGMPDSWELQYGLDPLNASDAALDYDNDGVSNLDEYLAGTNPNGNSANVIPIILNLLLE